MAPAPYSGDSSHGASSGRFAFLADAVSRVVEEQAVSADSSYLSERNLRRLEDPYTAVQSMMGVTAFAAYGLVPGLMLTGPNGQLLQLSVDEWAKAWSISKPTAWNESYWRQLCTTLDLAKLAAPMKLAILSRLLPNKQALIVQEGCIAHLENILRWRTIDIHACEADESRREATIGSMKTWLASCYEALQEISKNLDADFAVVDSSLALQRWVDFEPTGSAWSDYCHHEKLRCSQAEHIDFTSTDGWALRRDRLLRSISQFGVLKDAAMRGQLVPRLRETTSITDFHFIVDSMSKDLRFPSVDEFLGVCPGKAPAGNDKEICKHYQKRGTCKYGDACKYSHAATSGLPVADHSQRDVHQFRRSPVGSSPPYSGEPRTGERRRSMPDLRTPSVSAQVKTEDSGGPEQGKTDRMVCQHFDKHGTCKFCDGCKFQHQPKEAQDTTTPPEDDEPRRSERLRQKETKTVGAVSPVHSARENSEEICIKVLEINGQKRNCIVDSGAAVSLAVSDAVCSEAEIETCDKIRAVRGVGGGELTVHAKASLPVRGPTELIEVDFLVVDSLPYSHEYLLGWKDMVKLGLQVSPKRSDAQTISEFTLPPDDAGGTGSEGLDKLLAAEARIRKDAETCACKARDILVERGRVWSPLPAAEDYQGRVRELLPEEKRDLPDQTHTVEIRWDGSEPPAASGGDFSVRMMRNLSEEQRVAFAAECHKFISKGWWVKSSGLSSNSGPAGVSFPRFQGPWKSTSTRAVVDLKRWNSSRPKASWDGQPCSALVMSWRGRCSTKDSTIFLDLSKAYYKNRLHVSEVGWIFIRCLGELYKTDRTAFGAGFGCAAMAFGVRLLMTAVCIAIHLFLSTSEEPERVEQSFAEMSPADLQLALSGHGINWLDFLDDVLAFGPLHSIAMFTLCMRLTATIIGYEFPLPKIDVISEVPTSAVGPRHLGLTWTAAGASCVDVRQQLLAEDPSTAEAKLSKADLYRIAGLLQDVSRCHGERRYLADLIRRFGGRLPKKTPHPKADWQAKHHLSAEQTATLCSWIKAAADTYTEGCCHGPTGDRGQTLILYTDASSVGYGWALWRGSGLPNLAEDQPHNAEALMSMGYVLLEEEAKHFPGSRGQDWHVNRKELAGVASGLSAVYCWVFKRRMTTVKEVLVLGDNVSALKWAGIPDKPIKSFDVAGIRNLQSSLSELRVSLSQAGINVRFCHIQGKCNVIADQLSRLGVRFPLRPSTGNDQRPLVGVALEVSGELLHMIEAATACDTAIPAGLESCTVKGRSVLRRNGAIYIPESCRQRVLALAHSDNHLSGRRTVGAMANLATLAAELLEV